jgi:hypothetical protein
MIGIDKSAINVSIRQCIRMVWMFERNLTLLALIENLCGDFRLLQYALTCVSSPRYTHKTIAFICLALVPLLRSLMRRG